MSSTHTLVEPLDLAALPKLEGAETVDAYPYVDEGGQLLYAVVRYEPDPAGGTKTFRQYRPSLNGSGWVRNLGNVRRVLYQLPYVREHLAANSLEPLYICAGEKDVHAVMEAHGVATCNSGGEGGKWLPEHSDSLQGARNVVIVAHRDDTGTGHALEVRESLRGVGVDPQVVQAATGNDAHDHLAAGHTLDEFVPYVESPAPEPRFVVRTAREMYQQPEPAESDRLLGPLVTRKSRLFIVGEAGAGKTSLELQIAKVLTEGGEFLEWQSSGRCRVLVVDLEQGLRSIKKKLAATRLDGSDRVDYLSVPDGLALGTNADDLAELDNILGEGRYDVVALDPYYKAHRGDANEERATTDLMRTLDDLRVRHGFAFVMPVHPRKRPPGEHGVRKLTLDDMAGSGSLSWGVEVVVALERIADGKARLRFLKDREGDLTVGATVPLLYGIEDGFRLDASGDKEERNYVRELWLLSADMEWRTVTTWRKPVGKGGIGADDDNVRPALLELQERGLFEYAEGPDGKRKDAKCWRRHPSYEDFEEPPAGTYGVAGVLAGVRERSVVEVRPPAPPANTRRGGGWEAGGTYTRPAVAGDPARGYGWEPDTEQHADDGAAPLQSQSLFDEEEEP